MKGIGSSGALITIMLFVVKSLFGKKKRSRHRNFVTFSGSETPLDRLKRDNYERMRNLTRRFKDYTAEVIPFRVKGKNRVTKFRKVSIGDRVDVRLINDEFRIYVHDEYLAEIFPDTSSRLEMLLCDGVRFNAYLGGRDLAYRYDETLDSCSLIIFYKLPGIAPTIVNLDGR